METRFKSKGLTLFIVSSYLLFWLLLGFTGFLISIDVHEIVQTIMKNICAWSPTFAFLILYRKLVHDKPLKKYLKQRLKAKVKASDFITTLSLQLIAIILIISGYVWYNGISFSSLEFISAAAIPATFIINFTSGPLGEELGWRAYALEKLQLKYTPLNASIILGIIWGFWHLPLWILSGFTGMNLLFYILGFMVAIVSISVILTYFYNKSGSLLIAIWIHFWFNFLLQIIIADYLLHMIIMTGLIYFVIAVILVISGKKDMLQKYY